MLQRRIFVKETTAQSITAMQSISTSTSLGRRETSTVERAGGDVWKNSPYTAFISAKFFRLVRKTVVRTTLLIDAPDAMRIPCRFISARRVWALTLLSSIMAPVEGSRG